MGGDSAVRIGWCVSWLVAVFMVLATIKFPTQL